MVALEREAWRNECGIGLGYHICLTEQSVVFESDTASASLSSQWYPTRIPHLPH